MTILVNGKSVDVSPSQIAYEAIVKLADKTGNPTVTYRGPAKGDSQRSGTMYTGCALVELEPGMIFNVMHTGNA